MSTYTVPVLSTLIGYLLGSLPSGIWLCKWLSGQDIRSLGDGNSGARNVTHVLGWKAGIAVGVMDFCKGWLAVWSAQTLGAAPTWQLAAGASAVIGHNFPLYAGFRGGQGMAVTLGTMMKLFMVEVAIGLCLFGLLYLVTCRFDLSASVGLGSIALSLVLSRQPPILLAYTVTLFLSIPVKKLADAKRCGSIIVAENE